MTSSHRITAAEARAIQRDSYGAHLNEAYASIKEAAEDGRSLVKMTGEFWCRRTMHRYMACDLLREDGFTVVVYPTFTGISWR